MEILKNALLVILSGPTDMCCCQGQKDGTGKLIPWDTFYYLDGKVKSKKPKPCMGIGDKCTPQK